MGTRSRIGIELSDGSVLSSYCHWNGYPEYNGKILVTHYQNREDVQELIDGGSMSSLRTRSTWTSGSSLKDEKGNFIHDADGFMMSENDRDPQPLYHSERGDGQEPMKSDFETFTAGHSCEEYAYLYDLNGNWKAYKTGMVTGTVADPVEIPAPVTV